MKYLGVLCFAVPAWALKITNLVVFGASYCDNGHPRSVALSGSLTQGPYYDGGRWTNGKTWSEFLSEATSATLHNYAIGGSQNAADLTPGAYTAGDEVDLFLSDLENGSIQLGDNTLVGVWAGINKVKDIHADYVTANKTEEAWQTAQTQLTLNAQAILGQARQAKNAIGTQSNVSYLVLSIPPLERVPQMVYGLLNTTSDLDILANMTVTYNDVLKSGTAAGGNTTSDLLFFDAHAWWEQVSSPESATFKNTTWPCLNGPQGLVCAPCQDGSSDQMCENPEDYLYWDALHPTTAAHRALAIQLISVLDLQSNPVPSISPSSSTPSTASISSNWSSTSSSGGRPLFPVTALGTLISWAITGRLVVL